MPTLSDDLRARRSEPLVRWAFVPYFRWLFRKRFAALWVDGALPREGPVLVLANHTGWWDGPLALLLTALDSPLHGYVAMEATNLRRYGIFRRAGCFGLDRESPVRALGALTYAGELLHEPSSAVWIFPQGRMHHVDERPIGVEGGLAMLPRALRPGATPGDEARAPAVVSVSFRYEAGGEDRPEAFVHIGPPRPFPADAHRSPRAWLAAEEAALTATMDDHRARRIAGERGRCVIAGQAGVDRAWDAARALEDREVR